MGICRSLLAVTIGAALGATAVAAPASPTHKKKKKSETVHTPVEPYVMIFNPEAKGDRPQAVVETRDGDVPDAPLLLVTMGSGPTGDGGQDVEPEDVGVDEKSVILDKAQVDAPAGSNTGGEDGFGDGVSDDSKDTDAATTKSDKTKKKKKKKT